jgi:TetR/AcrR family transcriptional regulator
MSDKKSEILEAAKELFNRQGYQKTSLDDISHQVGMKKSSLYYYFKSKEELFIHAFKDEWNDIMAKHQNEAQKYASPDQKIISYITSSLQHYDETVIKHNIPVKVILETRNIFRIHMNEINEQRILFFSKCIEEGIKKGDFNKCDILKVAQTINLVKSSIQYDQYSVYEFRLPTLEEFKKIADEILFAVGLILNGLRKK